jgi:hypothetical protein
VQTPQLQHDEEQEEDERAARIEQVLSFLPVPQAASGNEVIWKFEDLEMSKSTFPDVDR